MPTPKTRNAFKMVFTSSTAVGKERIRPMPAIGFNRLPWNLNAKTGRRPERLKGANIATNNTGTSSRTSRPTKLNTDPESHAMTVSAHRSGSEKVRPSRTIITICRTSTGPAENANSMNTSSNPSVVRSRDWANCPSSRAFCNRRSVGSRVLSSWNSSSAMPEV